MTLALKVDSEKIYSRTESKIRVIIRISVLVTTSQSHVAASDNSEHNHLLGDGAATAAL